MRGAEPVTFKIVGSGGVIEPRVYRAAFVPALLAAVLAMFSLENRPRPLPQGLAADVLFDGRLAAVAAARIAGRQPDRRPGRSGNRVVAGLVARTLQERGFGVERTRFSHAGRELENVVGRRAGSTRRQIAVVAARDAAVVPDASGSAADTAALLELARVFGGRPSRSTLVLASIDGSTLGEVGAARLADELGEPDVVDAVLVVSDLGSGSGEGPSLQAWSNDSSRVGIGLQRTAADSIRQELDSFPEGTRVFGQLARLSLPIGIGPQGVLLERGYDALRFSGSGELPPGGRGPVAALDENQLGTLGRATLRTVTALDQSGAPEHGPGSYVTVVSQVVPGWVLTLLAVTLLLPVLVVAVDALARARRRGVGVVRWLRLPAGWTAPFLAGFATAELMALVGATPAPPPAPVPPEDLPLDGAALGVLGGVAAAMALAGMLGRFLAFRPEPALRERADAGAGVALAVTVGAAGLLLWLVNPYAGLLAVPAAHLWTLAVLTRPARPRAARALLVAIGALPPSLVALYYLVALSFDPIEGVWYLLLLVTGHSIGLATSLIGCLMLGTLCATVELVWRTPSAEPERPPEAGPSVYGPGSYAGPGSLGGTESALPR
jgi:hypothetical protein